MASVTFDHVTKAYADDVIAVNDLDLLVTDGEFLVLVGPSGCGKTTALRCLAGLEEITSGQIKIDARVVNRVPSKDRNIAMVFQSYALYPHMTVYDNLAFGLKLMKTPKKEIRRRVEEAAKILNLENLLDRKPRALSDHLWSDQDRRARREPRSVEGPEHRDGLPVLRALPAHDGVRQPRIRPQVDEDAEERDQTARRGSGQDPQPREPARPQATRALRSPLVRSRSTRAS